MHRSKPLALVSSILLWAGCGGARTGPRPTTASADAADRRGAPIDTLAVSGLRGTLSEREIEGALEPRLPRFLRCASERRSELEVLSGTLTLAFHVAVDGAVVAVAPSASTLGDRAAERCMIEVAQATRFPPPHGGEADFTWPLELPCDPELRAPVELSTERARPVVATHGAALLARCGGGQVVVTAYVDPGGAVLAAGAAAPDPATPAVLDCVVEGVSTWRFESPGSYLGKLSFALP